MRFGTFEQVRTGSKGVAITQEVLFVIGMLVLSSIILISSGVLISGLDLPFSTEQSSEITIQTLASKIQECKERSSTGIVNECETEILPVPYDINESEIEDFMEEEINFISGELKNQSQVSLRITYSERSESTNISVINKCSPWEGDTCADIPCNCRNSCAYEDPEISNDRGNALGCYTK
jgi:hypothetical protein